LYDWLVKKRVYIFWSIFIAAAAIRVYFSFYNHAPDAMNCVKQVVQGQGTIEEEPLINETGQVLVVNAERVFAGENICAQDILIRMKTKMYPLFSFGDNISFSGKINIPFNFKSNTGRSFDFKNYLAKDDIYFEIKSAIVIKRKEAIWYPSASIGKYIEEKLFDIKHLFVSNLNQTLGEPHAALAAGLVVGEKSSLGKDLLNDFRTVGLIHIVVLSGFNITIVADALRKMLSFLPRVWGIIIGALGILLFGILVGGGATVVRSCFMAGMALSADLIRRDYNVVRALLFAGLIMLIQNPMILLHDPSFQLSFLATLGLILLASPIEGKLGFIPEKFGMRGIVASTFATQIFVSPYILYMMGQLSIIGVVVNILVLPFIPATMLFVFLTGAGGFISLVIAQFFGWASHLLLSYELFMVEHFARIPFAAITLPQFSFWYVASFYIIFGIVYAIRVKLASTFSQLRFAKKSST
jgi:competence protein ComEC